MFPLEGVVVPIITPFDEEGRIGGYALRELIEWYASAGCHGLWVCGGTGEGVSLSRAQRAEMIELVQTIVAGRMKVVFHVGAASTADAEDAARRCQQAGVDAICSVPPFFYGKSERETIDYFAALGDATDRPLFIYNLPDASGNPLTSSLVLKIAEEVGSVAGIKHSGTNLDLVVEVLRGRNDLAVLVGRGELMLSGLVLGAQGCVCASLCLAPERFVAIFRAFQEGKLAEAMAAQRHATRVKELYTRFPVIGSTKRLNSAQIGIDCGAPLAPLAAVVGNDEEALLAQARSLGLLDAGVPGRNRPAGVPR